MKTLVIAPHPDDEILGCGGLLLNRKLNRSIVGWVIMTSSFILQMSIKIGQIYELNRLRM